jgi:hypothetical protein
MFLRTRGYGALELDGRFGAQTESAVCLARAGVAMMPSGVADEGLLELLRAIDPGVVEIPRVNTPLTTEERARALIAGHRRVFGVAPSASRLRMALAQIQAEHGSHALWNFNFGNVMTGAGWHGPWFQMDARERFTHGWQVHRSHWRAACSPDEGAGIYWRMMVQHFAAAIPMFDEGSPQGAAHALKAAGYYTATEASYARLLRACWEELR